VVQQQALVAPPPQQQQQQQQQHVSEVQQQQQSHILQQPVMQQQQAPVVQQPVMQQQQAAPVSQAVLSGSQGGIVAPRDMTGTLFTAQPHAASMLQQHAHALQQPVQQTGSPIHHQQQQQQQQVLAAAAAQQQAPLALHQVASTGPYMIHSAGMTVAGLQQPLTLSMAPGGTTYMTYDMSGHHAVQPLRYLTAMGGDNTLSYAVAGAGPPGLGLPNGTMAMAFGHGAGGLGEQQLGGGAMYAGDSLGQVYVLT
jgi:hypothetical protein